MDFLLDGVLFENIFRIPNHFSKTFKKTDNKRRYFEFIFVDFWTTLAKRKKTQLILLIT